MQLILMLFMYIVLKHLNIGYTQTNIVLFCYVQYPSQLRIYYLHTFDKKLDIFFSRFISKAIQSAKCASTCL